MVTRDLPLTPCCRCGKEIPAGELSWSVDVSQRVKQDGAAHLVGATENVGRLCIQCSTDTPVEDLRHRLSYLIDATCASHPGEGPPQGEPYWSIDVSRSVMEGETINSRGVGEHIGSLCNRHFRYEPIEDHTSLLHNLLLSRPTMERVGTCTAVWLATHPNVWLAAHPEFGTTVQDPRAAGP